MKNCLFVFLLIVPFLAFGQNYELGSTLWGTHFKVDGVRATPDNAIKLFPDSKDYTMWVQGHNKEMTSRAYAWTGLASALIGFPMTFSDNQGAKVMGWTFLGGGLTVSFIGLFQASEAKNKWKDLIILKGK